MQVVRYIVAQQCKEGGYRKRFVAVAQELEIYGMPIVVEGEEGDDRIDGDHE
jgi:hypothetical protein